MKTLFVWAAFACALLAPTTAAQSPQISAIVNSATYSPLNMTVHGLTTIFGTVLSDTVYQAGSLPWQTKLGKTSVFVCVGANCTAQPILYASPGLVNFLSPDSPCGVPLYFSPWCEVQVYVTVDSPSGPLSSAKFAANLEAYNPSILWLGYDCLIDPRFTDRNTQCGLGTPVSVRPQALRGAITDLKGNLLLSSNPAKPGGYYVIWLTGLGLSPGPKPPTQFGTPSLTIAFDNVPVYGSPGPTNLFATVPTYVGESPYPGLYQINFQLPLSLVTGNPTGYPPAWPCGNYDWEISVGFVPQFNSVDLQIPVSVRVGDVPCSN